MTTGEDTEPLALGDAVIPLLRGVVYRGPHQRAWAAIERLESPIRDYLKVLNLDVWVDPIEGYAYLRRRADVEPGTPNLLRRRALSFRTSLMLALLRRQLIHLDTQGDQPRLVITRDDVVEMVRTYHPSRTNETKLLSDVDADVNKLIEMGFLRRPRGQDNTVEVLRVVKAFVDAEWLNEFDHRLTEYVAFAGRESGLGETGQGDTDAADDEA
jgi:hypothetical protein